ncbi:FAD-binding protein [Psychrosphaera ytuae]|uniref:FAD-binding protein n=1 Tax=Psychrosphaera ytuae TaxID=2820710 RepID=A0A975HHG8_9GAMM|nr:FAD-binding protein [Psychrosphaera ytuae]QTH63105.1 FAD-binding protein [Psychrosphaera ytuae]
MNWQNALIEFLIKNAIEYSSKDHNSNELTHKNLCTYADSYDSQLVISPDNVEQVRDVTRFINDQNKQGAELTIYPVSKGQNWGYGSATPSSQNAILMSLHKLNSTPTWLSNRHDRDVPYGKTLGIVRIEAGVTQQQLYDFLQEQGGHFWMDATGSAVTSSVLANTLIRGFGHTAKGDHFEHCSGLEVVLADGRFIKTGHAGHIDAANIGVHKFGHGPVIEGIFSQSNLGIVTAMYLHLMPAKQYIKKFFVKLNSNEDYLDAVEALRPLKLSRVLDSQMHCGNTHKGIQALMRYPFRETEGSTPLPDSLVERISNKHDISPWTISGAVYADSSAELEAKSKIVKKALRKLNCKIIMLTPKQIELAQGLVNSGIVKSTLPNIANKLGKQLIVLKELLGLKQGKPTNYFIDSVYYRKRQVSEVAGVRDPDADNVGLFWLAPIGPMTRETIQLMIDTSTRVSQKFGFDPTLSITLLNEKAVDCVISIIFDRELPGEDEAALKCYDEMLNEFNKLGLYSYRSALRAMQTDSLGFDSNLKEVHCDLKNALDPHCTIGKNHYIQ